MKNSPVVTTEPAAVAALKRIYETGAPDSLEWYFSTPDQVSAQYGRLHASDGYLTGLNLNGCHIMDLSPLTDILY